MRLFVALCLPQELRAHIGDYQEPLRERYPELKWVDPDKIHLTLRFLGDVAVEVVGRVGSIVETLDPSPISFRVDRAGSFGRGRRGRPSVFWLGGEFGREAYSLADELSALPDDKGRKGRRGRFTPHLTIARRRRGGPTPELPQPGPWIGIMDKLRVYNSNLTPRGPEYDTMEEYELE
jgi:2'-5' RNA ligase